MADDLGYGDLSCYGHPVIETPVLDRLAQEGTRLTSFYAGATVCTPSRMALLTGCYPVRLGWEKGVVGYLMERGTGLAPEAVTMAEVFRQAGYRTGIFGKWHLGDPPPLRPHRQGFDVTFYINKSNNQTDQIWVGDEVVEQPFVNRLLSERFARETARFIEGTPGDVPFFAYVPFSAPHFPVEAHPAWKGKSEFGRFGDVVEEMDARIGEILAAIEGAGATGDTIVVFLSDNGPEPGTKESRADPLRGRKWSALEGGTRVPCIVRWPGQVAAGRECDALVAAIDLLPSLAHACGIELSEVRESDLPVDGVNLWPVIAGERGGPGRADLLYWHGRDGFEAIRAGDWKLFFTHDAARLPSGAESPGSTSEALFNLKTDPSETDDVSALHPEKVAELKALARGRLEALDSHRLELAQPRADSDATDR